MHRTRQLFYVDNTIMRVDDCKMQFNGHGGTATTARGRRWLQVLLAPTNGISAAASASTAARRRRRPCTAAPTATLHVQSCYAAWHCRGDAGGVDDNDA